MRVGGVEAPAHLVRASAAAALAAFFLTWAVAGFPIAVLVLTSFCCGAAVFSLVIDVCPGGQLPNFLSGLRPPRLHSLDCDLSRCPPLEPWRGVLVPREIDAALSDLYEHVLREFIYPWYGQVSLDEAFVQEVRLGLRHASAVLLKRVGKLDLTELITRKGIPIGLSHLDSFHRASQYANAFKTPIVESYYDFLGRNAHPATQSREREVLHIQNATRRVLPYLLPRKTLQSGSARALLVDILSGAVLQPVFDLLADPDTINLILEVAFDPEPSKKFPPASGETVEFLAAFVNSMSPMQRPPSALQMDLSAILKDQQALYAFMQFLKDEDAMNQLQFCLSVEDFNKRMMTPDLSDADLKSLHSEATDLHKMYLKQGAPSAVGVSQELAKEIQKILNGSPRNVEKLRTTTPLFKAYEEIFCNLERMCPPFFKSEQYFEYLLGSRNSSDPREKQMTMAEANVRASEKIGKGLSKIKHGVLGRSTEGVVDPQDTAFDVAHFVSDDEKEEDMSSLGSEAFGQELLVPRDLSSWVVSVPRLSTSQDAGGKPCFVFVIEIRTGMGETEPSLEIHRQYHEFYLLEGKLSEFHGELLEDAQLPPRPSKLLFGAGGQGLDFMQSKRDGFERYLQALLAKPALRGSEMLFNFLTAEGESWTSASASLTGLGLGRMIRSVPMKLAMKERGQAGLVPFVNTFVAQTQAVPPKPRHDYVVGAKEFDITLERPVEPHPLFRDNQGVAGTSSQQQGSSSSSSSSGRHGHCYKYYRDMPSRREEGIFDTLLYLAVNIFRVGKGKLQVLLGLRILFRRSLDNVVEWAIATKLSEVLCVKRVADICHLLERALFDESEVRTDDDKEKRKHLALTYFKDFLRPILGRAVGENYEEGVEAVFEALQNPVINKQLAMVLLDEALGLIFPELLDPAIESVYLK